MLDALTICPIKPREQPLAGLHTVVDSIGSVTFWSRLIEFMRTTAGGEHCVVWQLSRGCMHKVGAASWNGADQAQRRLLQYADPKFWRRDPALAAARRQTRTGSIMVRMDPRHVADTLIRETLYGEDHIRERILLCRIRPEAAFGLSVVRGEDGGPFSDPQLEMLAAVGDTLLSIVDKHSQIVAARRAYNPVSEENLSDIERSLRLADARLSPREAQVCARLICGRQLPAIASELGVGTETVETYRKRAYERLGVSSKQELLLRYLGYH